MRYHREGDHGGYNAERVKNRVDTFVMGIKIRRNWEEEQKEEEVRKEGGDS